MTTTKSAVKEAIERFESGDLRQNALHLFRKLGYNTEREGGLDTPQYQAFSDAYDSNLVLNEDRAKVHEWTYVDVLFQLSQDEMSKQGSLFDTRQVDQTIIESYLFLVIELEESSYTRTELSQITREVNRCFASPVLVLFKYDNALTLSVINRRLHKRKGVGAADILEKVTLIKDIQIQNTHRAHIEILFDLSFDELKSRLGFSNFVELHNAWQKTLDTSELNRRFFQELSNWYFWAVQTVEFPNDDAPDESRELRNSKNVIRLLTRLIFTWFLKEKGDLIPDAFFNKRKLDDILNYKDKTGSTYYKAILQNLFFASLNTEMPKDNYKVHTRQFVKRQNGVQSYLRYQRFFKDEEVGLSLFQDIPFLNGGLFENLDKAYNDKKTEIRIDCFSNRADNETRLSVPDFLFFGEKDEIIVDLNAAYGTKDKVYKVRPLISLLNRYKFTITENTPIEEEIALDPELLGRVFENLLASFNPETKTTARKLTGSFYTPREVVDYMVSESLKAYFTHHLVAFHNKNLKKQTPSVSQPQIDIFGKTPPQQAHLDVFAFELSGKEVATVAKNLEGLLRYDDAKHNFSVSEVDVLMQAIDQFKIIDPACGSGAFPMGVLQKLVFILRKLDADNEHWRKIQIERAQQETKKAFESSNIDERSVRLNEINEVFDLNASDYGRKLFLIENHIFGVDIQPIAVQISKLRFFISLIVEQTVDFKRQNLGIRPLPNLETKFVAADTLIGLPTRLNLFADSRKIEDLKKQLMIVRKDHFFARTPYKKEKHRNEDAEIRRQIRENLQKNIDDYCDALQAEINNFLMPLNLNLTAKSALVEDIKKKKEAKAADTVTRPLQMKLKKLHDTIISLQVQIDKRKTLIAQKPEHEANADAVASWNPYDQNQAAKFFHIEWMFSMPHTDGVGFDVVIGNPPYVQIQKLGREKQLQFEKQNFQTYDRTGDIYELFYERGCNLLAPNGVLCYITSNKWMRANYGKSTRRFLSGQTKPLQIIDFGNVQIFESATVDTNILITQKAKSDRTVKACRVDKANWDEETSLAQYVAENSYPLSNLSESEWIVGEKDVFDIKGRVEKQGVPLRKPHWDIDINYGIKTGLSDAFIIKSLRKNSLVADNPDTSNIIKPMLRGRDIQKFFPVFDDNWLITMLPSLELNIDDYPSIKRFFLEEIGLTRLQQIGAKNSRKRTNHKWFETQDSISYHENFEKPKIIYPEITKYLPFVYDEVNNFYCNNKGFILTGESLKYLTAVLNSKLFKYCFLDNFPELQGGTRELRKVFFEKIPIKHIESEEQEPFERLVEYIIYLKQQTLNTAQERLIPIYFEQILDGLVYELYFTETFDNANLSIHKHLLELPKLNTLEINDPSVFKEIKTVFNTLYDKKHPVRSAVFQMMSIPEVKLIHDTVNHLDKNEDISNADADDNDDD